MNDDQLRIGDAEREQAAAELGEHYVQGRLSTAEHTERLDRVWAARTRAELGPVFRDLPGRFGPVATSSARTARRASYWSGGVAPFRRGRPSPWVLVLGVLLVVTIATHVPVILVGAVVLMFVLTRHRGPGCHRNWSRSVR